MKYIKNQSNKFFELFFQKYYCGKFGSLTEEQIKSIYSSKFIIAENNPQILPNFWEDFKK